jgi:LmbE family N-acetylglucosaminyl deacetylase
MIAPEMVRVADLTPGSVIDLAGDRYADADSTNTTFQFELVVVDTVAIETPETIVVTLEQDGSFGFPPDHRVPRYWIDRRD